MPDVRTTNPRTLAAWIAGLAALILAFSSLAGCGKGGDTKEAAEQEAPTPVTVEPALRGAIDHVITADAVLYPINQANVIPKISAPVVQPIILPIIATPRISASRPTPWSAKRSTFNPE